jgi:hypothetical protein
MFEKHKAKKEAKERQREAKQYQDALAAPAA